MVAGFRAGFMAGLWMGGCPRRCGSAVPARLRIGSGALLNGVYGTMR